MTKLSMSEEEMLKRKYTRPYEKRIADLEKENAELKDDNKVMADNYSKMEQKFYDNLTKAKELLKQWLQTSNASSCDNINIVTDTKQFISEVEK